MEQTCIDQYTFLAGPYPFFPALPLDAYGGHTGLLIIGVFRIVHGPFGSYDNLNQELIRVKK